ncbi:putative copper-transporting ATPase [Clavispora lusitaniae]|uniref:Copper-transporting ATPase n=1 Tax=Clavispora lusitaniae TaxID=36911 RepID=A0ACD0WSQ2_CLALS|nr:hypothetical protein E0198_005238 [Clavispora lusitaniae]QFZ30320.1 putative copper-transporting ATPase [Clavispora lusitaniae]QFZ35982.1 putative copper-transporting ATPase [Clavispora lusitaniae]QFZ41666.1 putative copper-transporting ATPase [Clavispora lusitaniae]QFZ47342.1 putative copper-transporting ATPase [Clavispora lusitaniae]
MSVQHLDVSIANVHCPNCQVAVRQIVARRFQLKDFTSPPKRRSILSSPPYEIFYRLLGGQLDLYYHCTGDLNSSDLSLATKEILNGLRKAGFSVLSWEMELDGKPVTSAPFYEKKSRGPQVIANITGLWDKLLQVQGERNHAHICSYCQEKAAEEKRAHALEKETSKLQKSARTEEKEYVDPSTSESSMPLTKNTSPQVTEKYRAVFSVTGMTCAACVQSVTGAIEALFEEQNIPINEEEETVSVNLIQHMAAVIVPNKQLINKIVGAVDDAGFTCQLIEVSPASQKVHEKITAVIGGITCAACVNTVMSAVNKLPFVTDAGIDAITKMGHFVIESNNVDNENFLKLQEVIEDCGFDFELVKKEEINVTSRKSSSRTITIDVEGISSPKCCEAIMRYLDSFKAAVTINEAVTLIQPSVTITYVPDYESKVNVRRFLADLNHLHPADTEVGYIVDPNNHSSFSCKLKENVSMDEQLRRITRQETWQVAKRLILATVIGIPTFIFGILGMSLLSKKNSFRKWLEEPLWVGNVSRVMWIVFFLSTPVYFFATDIFHKKAIKEVSSLWMHKNSYRKRFLKFGSMNLLMSLGTTVAYVASLVLLGLSSRISAHDMGFHTTYFDSVVFLTFFLLIGRVLESISKAKTSDAVASLGSMKVSKVTLVDREQDGKSGNYTYKNDSLVDVSLLDSGDYVRISTGESPAVDCVIVQGDSEFDESALTGESHAVKHGPGHQVFSGTVNVGNNAVIAKILSVDGDSLIDQIINTVRDGQMKKAPIQRVADAITGYFVPIIVFIAILTWIIWLGLAYSGALPDSYLDIDVGGWAVWSLEFAIAVFVIACPCGIGLAAPTALFVGSGLAAKNGILARGGGAAFQDAAAINLVCFDKTGTLTCGEMKTTDFAFVSSAVKTSHVPALHKIALQTVRDLELASKHPIATAVKDFVSNYETKQDVHLSSVRIPQVETVPGKGLKGKIVHYDDDGDSFWRKYKPKFAVLGNEAMLNDHNVEITRVQQSLLDYWKKNRKSVMNLAIKCERIYGDKEFHLAAMMACRDEVRPEARAVVEHLKNRGIESWMITGDNKLTAAAIAHEIGIKQENVVSEILPHEKKNIVESLQQRDGAVVAMVGDGINDAPALAAANVGIALSSGADLAVTSSDFILLNKVHPIVTLCTLLDLAKVVFRRIKFNFCWSLVYNVIGIPIAAGVIYPINNSRLSPVWASAAMAASSLSVVTSSLLLGLYRPKIRSEQFVEAPEKETNVNVYEV